jgi:nitrite reductase/ring-hydroxylating ferredoxin subunit
MFYESNTCGRCFHGFEGGGSALGATEATPEPPAQKRNLRNLRIKFPDISWTDTGIETTTSQLSTPISVAGTELLLVRHELSWWAIEDRCSHADCTFSNDGEIVDLIAICDCHGSEFDVRTGAVLQPPADVPIATYPVRSVAGRLEVNT